MTDHSEAEAALLDEVKEILEGEERSLTATHEEVEARVTELQYIACIGHQEAHRAYAMFFKSMVKSAEHNGMTMSAFMEAVGEDRKKVWIGMMCGLVTCEDCPDYLIYPLKQGPVA